MCGLPRLSLSALSETCILPSRLYSALLYRSFNSVLRTLFLAGSISRSLMHAAPRLRRPRKVFLPPTLSFYSSLSPALTQLPTTHSDCCHLSLSTCSVSATVTQIVFDSNMVSYVLNGDLWFRSCSTSGRSCNLFYKLAAI